ncbi:hypothetical protein V8G54_000971 [Vigna mungo]|uniref:Uncharacterized protein n=1 Tax=Vigna mungo TaxID=3915 RepID=A0AAQ3S9F9_VIGMU
MNHLKITIERLNMWKLFRWWCVFINGFASSSQLLNFFFHGFFSPFASQYFSHNTTHARVLFLRRWWRRWTPCCTTCPLLIKQTQPHHYRTTQPHQCPATKRVATMRRDLMKIRNGRGL